MQGTQQRKSIRLWVAVCASSLLYAAAHPPWALWPSALVAIAPVSAVLLDPRARIGWRRAGLAGFLFGSLSTWLLVASWSRTVAQQFLGGSPLAALAFTAALLLIASGIALYYAVLFALLSRLAGFGALVAVVGSAALWAAAELARTSIGYGNPWGSFAAALVAADAALSGFRAETPIAALLGVGGAPAVAFLAGASGAALGLAWAERSSAVARGRAIASGAAVVAALLIASHAGEEFAPGRGGAAAATQPLRVALVQPGVGKSHRADGDREAAGAAQSFDRLVELTRSVDTRGADLIVWPDDALPFLLGANEGEQTKLRTLAHERGAALLVGGSHSAPDRDASASVFRCAFLFPADGGEPLVYDKRILLPFIERVPGWAAPYSASPRQGAFAAGTGPGILQVKGWHIAPLLGLEAVYPDEAAARVADGADLLVDLSDDSWFDEGAGAEQHFTLSMLRAAETRRPLVRVATTGVSALVAENGLVSWRLPARTTAVALLDVVPPRHDSLFVRGGRSGFALLVIVIAGAAAALPGWSRCDAEESPDE